MTLQSDIVTELNNLNSIKQAIKAALIAKGVAVSDSDTFMSYASKIGEIQMGGTRVDTDWGFYIIDTTTNTAKCYISFPETAGASAQYGDYAKTISLPFSYTDSYGILNNIYYGSAGKVYNSVNMTVDVSGSNITINYPVMSSPSASNYIRVLIDGNISTGGS